MKEKILSTKAKILSTFLTMYHLKSMVNHIIQVSDIAATMKIYFVSLNVTDQV